MNSVREHCLYRRLLCAEYLHRSVMVMMCRARVVVTETFDSGLLGEHVLISLCDAWTRLVDTELEVCLSICLSVCLSICQSVSLCLFVCMSAHFCKHVNC